MPGDQWYNPGSNVGDILASKEAERPKRGEDQ